MLSKTYDRIRVLPYAVYSKSAKHIADALGAKRIKLEGSKFHGTHKDLIINWGNLQGYPFTMDRAVGIPCPTILNCPEDAARVSDKLSFFEHFEGKDWLPRFWTKQEDIPDEAFPIVCRTVLNGHSGRGIVISASRSDLVPAPLYVEYIKKEDEYRVHVGSYNDGSGNNEYCLISIQQKKRRKDFENPNWQVRNHANGFIYARNNVDPPIPVVECAIDCLDGSGLDFAAIDVIWNAKHGKAYALELNTAPGIEGSTVDDYVRYFRGEATTLQKVLDKA